MRLQMQRFGRSLWLNTLALTLATCGIYGLNGATARKVLLTFAVSILFATIASVVSGRSETCGNPAA
jgi:hypothetical protein